MLLQLELGSTATPYEPYKESIGYISAKDENGDVIELRSLPNGVKDDVNVAEGKLIKRVSDDKTVSGTDYTDFNTAWTNGDRIKISINALFGNAPTDQIFNQIQGAIKIDGWAETISVDSADNVGKFYTTGTGFDVWFIVAKGTYIDLADVQANFPSHTLTYQLATPVMLPVDIIGGPLIVYPNGTMMIEPCISGFMSEPVKVVTTEELPISEVRKVIRYDISDTGQLILTDVTANVTVGDNNTSLTIANFESGKTYFYDCAYPSELTTQPEMVADVEVDNGIITHDYQASAADWVLDANEAKATMLICTNAGGAARIITPPCDGKIYVVRNDSGQNITIKTASSTGVTISTAKTTTVIFTGTDFIKLSEV